MANYTTDQRQKLIAQLQELIPSLVEELFEQLQQQEEPPTLLEIEHTVRRIIKPLGREMVLGVVSQLTRNQSPEPPLCRCGELTTYEHVKPLLLLSMWDTIRLERPYFSCAPCRHGTVPLDQALRIGPGQISPALEESISMLGACIPFALAVKVLGKLLDIDLPAKTAQRVTQRIGAEMESQQQQAIRQAWEAYEFPSPEGDAPEVLYLSVDGTTVRLEDGYHEAKVAAFHQAEIRISRQGERELHAVDITYVVAMDEPAEEFAKRVLVEGYRRGWQQAQRVVVLGDGAAWIWNHIAAQVPDSVEKVEIVDFYHANEHLWEVGKAVLGEGTAETTAWVEARLDDLLRGDIAAVIAEVEDLWLATGAPREQLACLGEEKAKDLPEPRKTIREAWTYFSNNQERMCYNEYRQRGFFIGSGTVESACKRLIGARLKQSGMQWSKEGAHRVMQVRAALLSDRNRWDCFWGNRRPPPRHRQCRAKAA
jgi:hypothetical protein